MFVVSQMTAKALVRVKNCYPEMIEEIKLNFAEGMIGVLPVFETREQAEKFADGAEIFEIELKINHSVMR